MRNCKQEPPRYTYTRNLKNAWMTSGKERHADGKHGNAAREHVDAADCNVEESGEVLLASGDEVTKRPGVRGCPEQTEDEKENAEKYVPICQGTVVRHHRRVGVSHVTDESIVLVVQIPVSYNMLSLN